MSMSQTEKIDKSVKKERFVPCKICHIYVEKVIVKDEKIL